MQVGSAPRDRCTPRLRERQKETTNTLTFGVAALEFGQLVRDGNAHDLSHGAQAGRQAAAAAPAAAAWRWQWAAAAAGGIAASSSSAAATPAPAARHEVSGQGGRQLRVHRACQLWEPTAWVGAGIAPPEPAAKLFCSGAESG